MFRRIRQQHRYYRTSLSIRSRCGRRARRHRQMRRIMVSGRSFYEARREHDPLGASACRRSRCRLRDKISAAGTEVPHTKPEIKSGPASVLGTSGRSRASIVKAVLISRTVPGWWTWTCRPIVRPAIRLAEAIVHERTDLPRLRASTRFVRFPLGEPRLRLPSFA